MIRIAILVSGRGSNMQRLIELCRQHHQAAKIVLVASNKPCDGINYARDHGLAVAVADQATKFAREEYISSAIDAASADWIFLAGYMAVLSPEFVAKYTGRILNIHPSLLPDFKGLNTHERALAAGKKRHGVSVHVVTPALDDGPVILQAGIDVAARDDATSLGQRVLALEHQLYPFVLANLAYGNLRITEGRPEWFRAKAEKMDIDAATKDFLDSHVIWP